MSENFAGKVALVTGAAAGIGFATARAFAEAGASVVLVDLDAESTRKAAEALVDTGQRTLALSCDVSDEAAVKVMVERSVAEFDRIDMAFNNAGVMVENVETADASGEDFDRVIAVNLKGMWNCLKHELV